MKRCSFLLLVVTVLAAGCESQQPTQPLDLQPSFEIWDGVHGLNGNEHFFWLPPMITPAPSFSGDFDATADPVVVICEEAVSDCSEPVLTIALGSGLDLDALEEWYGADWYVFDHDPDEGDIFRISVTASGQLLGFADLMIVDKVTGKLKKAFGDEYILLSEKNGKKYVKIRFRIEEGAVPNLGLGVGFGDEQFSLISAGFFQMGDAVGNGLYGDELPVHPVEITNSFYMQRTEVTQAQWQLVMGSNPSNYPSCGVTCPVDMVSWNDIQIFLAALNVQDPGKNYRLPTEAEWEYACRAGTTGDYGGTGVLDEMGWYSDNAGGTVHPVAGLQPNAWGLYDMHGNVWEWVQDWWWPDYYSYSPTIDPPGPDVPLQELPIRVLRSGSWVHVAWSARSSYRPGGDPASGGFDTGFRLVRTQ
jgi:hypothetical protein